MRRRAANLLAATCVLTLLACSAPAETRAPQAAPTAARSTAPPAAAVATAPAAPTPPPVQRFDVATATLSATSTPLWVAVDHGIFQRYGFEVEVKGLSPAATVQALQAGSVPFAATAGTAISAYASGATELVLVAGLLNKLLFQLLGQPDVARVEDLRGKTVGNSTPGSSAATGLMEVLRRYGLDPERDVSILYLRDQPGILGGLTSGQIGGAFLASPYNSQARAQGYRLLVDTLDLDVELLGLALATTRGQVEREPDATRRFVMAYVEGINFARHQPEPTIDSILRGTRSDDRALATDTYAVYRRVWEAQVSPRAFQTLVDSLDTPGARGVRFEQVVDERILRELTASGWLAQHLTPP